MSKMKLVSVHMPESYVEGLKKLIEQGRYPTISEAVRTAVRCLLKREYSLRKIPKRMIA